jgi:hypothetical protein
MSLIISDTTVLLKKNQIHINFSKHKKIVHKTTQTKPSVRKQVKDSSNNG